MITFMPYIGGKHRMAAEIAKRLHATGATTLVDVFGGSAAVLLNAGFEKRIYNDANQDLAHLFRTMADPGTRAQLYDRIRWTPVCRAIFENDYATYCAAGFSFQGAPPIERARATLYRQLLAWGGKGRSGGFSSSPAANRPSLREVGRYQKTLDKIEAVGEFFRGTCIENLGYQEAIAKYGDKPSVVLFCDPPPTTGPRITTKPDSPRQTTFFWHTNWQPRRRRPSAPATEPRRQRSFTRPPRGPGSR